MQKTRKWNMQSLNSKKVRFSQLKNVSFFYKKLWPCLFHFFIFTDICSKKLKRDAKAEKVGNFNLDFFLIWGKISDIPLHLQRARECSERDCLKKTQKSIFYWCEKGCDTEFKTKLAGIFSWTRHLIQTWRSQKNALWLLLILFWQQEFLWFFPCNFSHGVSLFTVELLLQQFKKKV